MKDLPIDEKQHDKELASTQDRIETYLKNRIADLTRQRDAGEKDAPRKPIEYNETNKGLREQAKELQKVLDDLVGDKELSTEDKIKRAIQAVERSEANWDSKIRNKDFEPAKKEELSSPELEAAKTKRDAKKAEFDKLRDEAFPPEAPKTQLQKLIDKASKLTDEINTAKKEGRTKDAAQLEKERALTEGQIPNLAKEAKRLEEAAKTPEQKHIEKLQEQLDKILSGDFDNPKEKQKVIDSKEVKDLKDQIFRAKQEAGLIAGKGDPQTIATENKLKSLEREITNLNKTIHDTLKGVEKKKNTQIQSAAIDAAKERKGEGQRILKQLRDELGIAEKAKLKQQIEAVQKRIAEKEKALASGDPDKILPKTKIKSDIEAKTKENEVLKKQLINAQRKEQITNKKILDAREANKQANKSKFDKVIDNIQRYHVFNLLLDPNILGKLMGHTVTEASMKVIDETFGAAAHKLFPNLSIGSTLEHPTMKSMSEYYSTFVTSPAYIDAMNTWHNGQNSIDAMYGKRKNFDNNLFEKITSKPGITHNMEKTIIQTAEYKMSLYKRIQAALKENPELDLTDEYTRMTIESQAAADSFNAKLMNNTVLNDMINRAMSGDGNWNKFAKVVVSLLMPIRNVPLNVVRQTLIRVGGVPYEATHLIGREVYKAFGGVLDDFTPEQKTKILSHISKGSTGAILVAVGVMNPNMFGGFYQRGQRDSQDLKSGGLKMFGHNVPDWLAKIISANPAFLAIQFGATVRRNMDNKFYRQEKNVGLVNGVAKAFGGFEEHIPMLNEGSRISDAMSSDDKARTFVVNFLEGFYLPRPVSRFAEFEDKDSNGNPIKRKPTGWGQAFEKNIPGLRKNVHSNKR
jgi:hypothetical protein